MYNVRVCVGRNLRQFLSEDTFTHVHISKTEIKDVHTFCMLSTYEAFTFQTFDLCGISGNEALLKKFDLSQNSITLPFTEVPTHYKRGNALKLACARLFEKAADQ